MRLISTEDCEAPATLWWGLVAAAAVIGFAIPSFVGLDVVMSTSIIFVYAILTLSMSYLWGYCGMLSFGQTAMYGVGGYAYAVIALNSGNTTIAVFAAVPSAIFRATLPVKPSVTTTSTSPWVTP